MVSVFSTTFDRANVCPMFIQSSVSGPSANHQRTISGPLMVRTAALVSGCLGIRVDCGQLLVSTMQNKIIVSVALRASPHSGFIC